MSMTRLPWTIWAFFVTAIMVLFLFQYYCYLRLYC
jgi:hypothetical protein